MIRVGAAQPHQYERALRLLFHGNRADAQSGPPDGDVLEAVTQGEISLEGLLVAERGGAVIGAALYVMQPDATAFVWAPRVADESLGDQVADLLLSETSRRIDREGAWLGQCLVEPSEPVDRPALCRNGFEHLADLIYLERSLRRPLPGRTGIDFETVRFNPSRNESRFAAIVESTYVETLDCPALNGKRSGTEALVGHQTAGRFDAARWKIYRVQDADVGVMLLNDHPDQDAWELVYMGVVPQARGRGLGRAMLLEGLYEAHAAGRNAVLLAVDSRNRYARAIYDELGFAEQAVRAVYARCR